MKDSRQKEIKKIHDSVHGYSLPSYMGSTSLQNSIGGRLMWKLGWRPGKGLGAKEDGILVPLRIEYRSATKDSDDIIAVLHKSDTDFVKKSLDLWKDRMKSRDNLKLFGDVPSGVIVLELSNSSTDIPSGRLSRPYLEEQIIEWLQDKGYILNVSVDYKLGYSTEINDDCIVVQSPTVRPPPLTVTIETLNEDHAFNLLSILDCTKVAIILDSSHLSLEYDVFGRFQ